MSALVVLAAVSLVVAAAALVWLVVGIRRDRAEHASRLPAGAETALLSIVEAMPDPRNSLALTRDLTGEVRIAGTPLDWSDRDALDRAS